MRNRFLILLTPLLLALAGCQAGWQPGGATFTAEKNAFSVQVPSGWQYTPNLGPVRGADLFATKDGIYLQRLIVDHHLLKDPLPNSKRTVTDKMSPFEVAEAIVDDYRSDHGLLHFEINGNTPANVGGRPGFRLLMHYRNKENLQLTELRYGAVVGDRIWFIRFVAPSRHYFDQDVGAFETAAQSFKLSAP